MKALTRLRAQGRLPGLPVPAHGGHKPHGGFKVLTALGQAASLCRFGCCFKLKALSRLSEPGCGQSDGSVWLKASLAESLFLS